MKKAKKERQTDYSKYGTDALKAWDAYKIHGDAHDLHPVIADRLLVMRPELVKTLYTFVLVFSQK